MSLFYISYLNIWDFPGIRECIPGLIFIFKDFSVDYRLCFLYYTSCIPLELVCWNFIPCVKEIRKEFGDMTFRSNQIMTVEPLWDQQPYEGRVENWLTLFSPWENSGSSWPAVRRDLIMPQPCQHLLPSSSASRSVGNQSLRPFGVWCLWPYLTPSFTSLPSLQLAFLAFSVFSFLLVNWCLIVFQLTFV